MGFSGRRTIEKERAEARRRREGQSGKKDPKGGKSLPQVDFSHKPEDDVKLMQEPESKEHFKLGDGVFKPGGTHDYEKLHNDDKWF